MNSNKQTHTTRVHHSSEQSKGFLNYKEAMAVLINELTKDRSQTECIQREVEAYVISL